MMTDVLPDHALPCRCGYKTMSGVLTDHALPHGRGDHALPHGKGDTG